MLDAREINLAIAELEFKESSYGNYSKLASLYTIRDHMEQGTRPVDYGYSLAPAPREVVEASGSSEFLQAVAGKDSAAAWRIMDDLMSSLQVLNGKVYQRVIDRLHRL